MKFNLKSKLGFTLIELLVVIGILAVLAAIAIPSVAGLIDRANVSADSTNANEMTNAIERFTSEYELYKQDISSEKVNINNLDSVQSRIYNSIGATTLKDIELLESIGFDGKQIDRDTKYPKNPETASAILTNYIKTESSVFLPKQSDCHYYFSPQIGIVVCAETTKSSPTELNALVLSGKDAKGNELNENIEWIDISVKNSVGINHNSNIVSRGAKYISKNGTTYTEGMELPALQKGDRYIYGDYSYIYLAEDFGVYLEGWTVFVRTECKGKETYASPISYIRNEPVVKARQTFQNSATLKYAPKMPDTIIDMTQTFFNCSSLEYCPDLPNSVIYASHTFEGCKSLTTPPKMSANVENMFMCFAKSGINRLPNLQHCVKIKELTSTFYSCDNIIDASNFHIPSTVEACSSLLKGSKNLKTAPKIPANVLKINSAFADCASLEGTLYIDSTTLNEYQYVLRGTKITKIEGNLPDDLKTAILQTK